MKIPVKFLKSLFTNWTRFAKATKSRQILEKHGGHFDLTNYQKDPVKLKFWKKTTSNKSEKPVKFRKNPNPREIIILQKITSISRFFLEKCEKEDTFQPGEFSGPVKLRKKWLHENQGIANSNRFNFGEVRKSHRFDG